MSCNTPACQPPVATTLFFPGTQGPKGDKGDPSSVPGPTGETGPAGAVGVYTGPFSSSGTYFDTAYRKDIVFYAGLFWITNNPAISGSSTWGQPNVRDWAPFGSTLTLIATGWALLTPQTIPVGVTVEDPGYLRSENQVADTSGWLLTALGRLEAYDAVIKGKISTDTPKFNMSSVNRTMPGVGWGEFEIPPIVDADIPVNPLINNVTNDALIIFGPTQDANSFLDNRFGNTTQKFTVNLNGTGSNTSAGTDQFYIQIYYRTRTNGGAWDPWVVIGQDAYMQKLAGLNQSFDVTRCLKIALGVDQDIQFSAGFSKGAAGTCAVDGAKITVEAFN